jgi:probable HAF family extracellular repeat protein
MEHRAWKRIVVGGMLVAAVIGALAGVTRAQAGADIARPRYRITVFDPLPGMDYAGPLDMNERGEIVGYSAPEPFHPLALPVHVDEDGNVTMPQPPDPTFNFVHGLNESAVLVGTSGQRAYAWVQGEPRLLRLPQAIFSGAAQDVTARGLVCGSVGDSDWIGPQHCYWPTPTAVARILPGLFAQSTTGVATAVNESGQIAGTSGGLVGSFFAVRWDQPDAPPFQIGPLPGAMNSDGLDMNENGDVVGRSSYPDGRTEAFLYRSAGDDLVGLGFFASADIPYSEALGVNDRQQVVGSGNAGPGIAHAFLWQSGVMLDLNDLVVLQPPVLHLSAAVAINERGEIAAEAVVGPYPERRIVLLRPTP